MTLRDKEKTLCNDVSCAEVFLKKEIKNHLNEFNEYQISYYPGMWKCNICKKEFCLIYHKNNNERYCKNCLSLKIFGDFNE